MNKYLLQKNHSGRWVLSQSFSTLSISICQPSPVARNLCTTSWDSWSVRLSLIGTCWASRAANLFFSASGKVENGTAEIKSSSVNYWTSPSMLVNNFWFFIFFCLSCICFTKTDIAEFTWMRYKYKKEFSKVLNKRPRRKQRGIVTLFLTFHTPQGAGNLPVILLKWISQLSNTG